MKTQLTNKSCACLMAVVLAMLHCAPLANAAFHAWVVDEIYSSADGTVQFIEVRALAGGQQPIGGQSIKSTNSAGVNTFTFPTGLPSDSGGKSFLLGTTNFASHPGGVTPNYIIPPNFIRAPIVGDAAVIFNPNPFSPSVYSILPTDGRSALLRPAVGNTMIVVPTNSPRNFALQSNAIVPVKFNSAGLSSGNVVVAFATATGPNNSTGPNYAVEASSAVGPAAWSVATNVTGNGSIQTLSLPVNLATNQIFRLRVP